MYFIYVYSHAYGLKRCNGCTIELYDMYTPGWILQDVFQCDYSHRMNSGASTD
jgi:hypothetical protein